MRGKIITLGLSVVIGFSSLFTSCNKHEKPKSNGEVCYAITCVELVSKRLSESGVYYNLPLHKALASAGRPISLVSSVEVAVDPQDENWIIISVSTWRLKDIKFEGVYLLNVNGIVINSFYSARKEKSDLEVGEICYNFRVQKNDFKKAKRVMLGMNNEEDIILSRRDISEISRYISDRLKSGKDVGVFYKNIEF